jgi:hypothetical protein
VVFENYKSLDESSPSGIADIFTPATGVAAPVLIPALKLYKLLNDILSSEAQLKLCRYFQVLETTDAFLHSFAPKFPLSSFSICIDGCKEEVQMALGRNR